MKPDTAELAGRAIPPVAVAGAHYIMGISLPDWVTILTIIWLLIVIGEKLWSIVRKNKPEKYHRRRRTD
ncbi:hypothetical protein [Arenimonas sp.]|uniref:hypothetical protein n=1 Tax=Arenimonas sp. TaxID=1872635 RepID=UPI0039E45E5A